MKPLEEICLMKCWKSHLVKFLWIRFECFLQDLLRDSSLCRTHTQWVLCTSFWWMFYFLQSITWHTSKYIIKLQIFFWLFHLTYNCSIWSQFSWFIFDTRCHHSTLDCQDWLFQCLKRLTNCRISKHLVKHL